jgi:hypothetical protein
MMRSSTCRAITSAPFGTIPWLRNQRIPRTMPCWPNSIFADKFSRRRLGRFPRGCEFGGSGPETVLFEVGPTHFWASELATIPVRRGMGILGKEVFWAVVRQSGTTHRDLARCDRNHFVPTGTFCFNSSNQLSTTLIWVGAVPACSVCLSIRKCWPSGETS